MIVVDLKQLRSQVVITRNMERAIDFLERFGQEAMPVGKRVIDGERVFAEVQAYDTIEGGIEQLEGHRRYIDIQYVANGEEIIGWASIDHGREMSPYVVEHDYWLATADAAHVTEVRLTAGQLAVMHPADLHAPRRAAGTSSPVNKLVIKVEIDE